MAGTLLQIVIDDARKFKKRYEWGQAFPSKGFKLYACHEKQLEVLRSKAKYTFAFAGTGGGKTACVPLSLFKQLEKNKGKGRYLIVSPSMPTFKSSQLSEHIETVFANTKYDCAGTWNGQAKTWKLPTGAEIIVRTAENPADVKRLTGGQYHGIILDECWALPAEVWAEVRRRSNMEQAPILGVTTPNVDGWLFSEVQSAFDAGDKEFNVIRWRTEDNPKKTAEEHASFLEAERKKIGDARYARMYEGQFTRLEGLVYPAFSDAKAKAYPVVSGDPYKVLASPPVRFFGDIDWGYRPDPAVIHMIAECEDGVMYVVEEVYVNEMSHAELALRARKLVDKWAVADDGSGDLPRGYFAGFYCDASRPEAVKAFKQMGLKIRNRKVDDICAGLQTVDAWFNAGRLKVYETCPNTIRELRAYQWAKDRGGDLKQLPIGKNDHTCDALRYGVSSFKYGQSPNPISYEPPSEEAEAEKVERLGLTEDSEALKEREEELEKQRFDALVNGYDDNDDPFGVWEKI
jgi:PBSX family phage terminase large subunit